MASEHIVTFDAESVKPEALKDKGLALVDFWASWCGPCRMVAPIIEQLAAEYEGKAVVGKLNIDDHPDAANAYGVSSIPTMILFKDGEEVERLVGARGKAAIAEVIDQHL